MEKYLIVHNCHKHYYKASKHELDALLQMAVSLGAQCTSESILEQPYSEVLRDKLKPQDCKSLDSIVSVVQTPRIESLDLKDNVAFNLLVDRAVLMKRAIQIWHVAVGWEALTTHLKQYGNEYMEKHVRSIHRQNHNEGPATFKITMSAFNKKLSKSVADERVKEIGVLMFREEDGVQMRTPTAVLAVWEFHPFRSSENSVFVIGRLVSEHEPFKVGKDFVLKERSILGPTTMDCDLSFLMNNLAKTDKDSIVMDPFCGTCGTLLAASSIGALCLGSDIDMRVLLGTGVSYIKCQAEESLQTDVWQNFKTYNLPLPEILRADIFKTSWKGEGWVSSIVCDPPYGVRAGCRKFKKKEEALRKTKAQEEENELIPSTEKFDVDSIIGVLLDFASRMLVENGTLVFLLHVNLKNAGRGKKNSELANLPKQINNDPTIPEEDDELQFAVPQCVLESNTLKLISYPLQRLSTGTGRLIVTMVRTSVPFVAQK